MSHQGSDMHMNDPMEEIKSAEDTKSGRSNEKPLGLEEIQDTIPLTPKEENLEDNVNHLGVDLFTHNKIDGLPSAEPSSLALETLLRVMGVNYRIVQQLKPCEKAFIIVKGKTISGCLVVADEMKRLAGININHKLSVKDAAIIRFFTTHLENQTDFCLLYYRWFDQVKEWRNATNKYRGANLFRYLFLESKCQRLLANRMELLGQHLAGREQVAISVLHDLRCLSTLLDNKYVDLRDRMYFMGTHPCTLDCVVFGITAHILYCSVETKFKQIILKTFTNLAQHCDRIREQFWTDWSQLIGKYRICVTPRFFMSLRRAKPKSNLNLINGEEKLTELHTTCEKYTVIIVDQDEVLKEGSCDKKYALRDTNRETQRLCASLCPCPLDEDKAAGCKCDT
ncbi:hypothetical protein RF11_07289 [Thelohanellus kitauei]|uniref:Uncharacterized protein n=1 Tax=Thelohanellus kitauei TaxID=669202 RepID=A0A0C2N727_THEKT|nr:hypothetical protein RF11_07289 [Thelohanellus kitauei]